MFLNAFLDALSGLYTALLCDFLTNYSSSLRLASTPQNPRWPITMTEHPTTAAPRVRPPIILTHDITLQSPLSRRGHGPGLVLVVNHYAALDESATSLDPPPLQKWAEEGFAVAQIKVPGRVGEGGEFPLERALEALKGLEGFDGGDVGLVCRCFECSIPIDTFPFPFGASGAGWSCL